MPSIAKYAGDQKMVAGQKQNFVVHPVTLPDGRTLDDWDTFTMTVRLNPNWPESAFARSDDLDPEGDNWLVLVQVAGSKTDSTTLTFPFAEVDAAKLLAGPEGRSAFDVTATGGTAGRVQLVPAMWLPVKPSVY